MLKKRAAPCIKYGQFLRSAWYEESQEMFWFYGFRGSVGGSVHEEVRVPKFIYDFFVFTSNEQTISYYDYWGMR